jgi:hypothetical protein
MNADPQQLSNALQSDLVHVVVLTIYGVLCSIFGVIAWLVRRSIRMLDGHISSMEEKLDSLEERVAETCEGLSWCQGVICASGLAPKPLSPGIGGTS